MGPKRLPNSSVNFSSSVGVINVPPMYPSSRDFLEDLGVHDTRTAYRRCRGHWHGLEASPQGERLHYIGDYSVAMTTNAQDPRLRQLKIKTNVVKRISKDKAKYEEELVDLQRDLEEKKASGADEYMIKKACELIDESRMMVSDCSSRLARAVDVLTTAVADCEDLCDHEEYQFAQELIAGRSGSDT
ncbi:Tubulin-specific chaperone A [Echinococcus granulosus]|uniref:Tubulin-specific chaperone A n=1 Tax=Echinococcus granulosus TaxID=6210 RepID=W6UGJ7_ECHGR|nr:Tubulin-specific chaperone A [Echinococcus granulosus]EUB60640.1 Tubulin-specific chaperone A [Echinococcus granulosus]